MNRKEKKNWRKKSLHDTINVQSNSQRHSVELETGGHLGVGSYLNNIHHRKQLRDIKENNQHKKINNCKHSTINRQTSRFPHHAHDYSHTPPRSLFTLLDSPSAKHQLNSSVFKQRIYKGDGGGGLLQICSFFTSNISHIHNLHITFLNRNKAYLKKMTKG